ncbi:4-hydroxybenzoate polyprenyl transferase [Suillus lakei]|nr:4-hydroxybenzoate polyprenyl transferase [Suillus lakei]
MDKSLIINNHLEDGGPAPAPTWVDHLPSNIRPFFYLARAHRPSGALLLFFPCAWSVTMSCYALSAPITTVWTYLGFFLVASQVFHAAGCVINDMWDKDIDAAISRTCMRPLAAGDISMFQAFIFLILQLALGIWLFMQLNEFSFVLGLSSLVLVVLYPAMKRINDWPQIVLGLCLSWGAFMGTASVAGTVDCNVYIPLFMGGVCWTIAYSSSYAHQDRKEYVKSGLYSAAIVFGDQIRPILVMFTFVACAFVSYAGMLNGHGFPFFVGVALGALHLVVLIARTDFENKGSCDASLLNNCWFGFWIWAGAMADYYVKMQL